MLNNNRKTLRLRLRNISLNDLEIFNCSIKMGHNQIYYVRLLIYLMAFILKTFRNVLSQAKFKAASLFRGEQMIGVETAVAFNIKHKEKQKVILKMHQYPELNQYFIAFLNSAETGGRINGDNLAFLIGAQKVGKTTFVENNLQTFKKIKMAVNDKNKKVSPIDIHRYKSPELVENEIRQTMFDNEHFLVLNFNFQKNRALSFTGMINQIHETIINQIVRLSNRFNNGSLLNCEVIKEVLICQNSEEYLFIYIKDVIYCILNGTDPIQLSNEAIKQLQILNQNIINKQNNSAVFFELNGPYKQLIEIISKDKKITETEAALRLFLSVGKRIQYEHRPITHIYSWYQSGIESTNILFDILNFLCGLGRLNKTLFQKYFDSDLKSSHQSSSLIKAETNWIKSGNRLDVAMFLLNLGDLYIYDTPQFWNFIDHLISRTANSSGLRTHFPLMIQFPNYADFQNMHNMGQFNLASPVVLEIPGYIQHTLRVSNLAQIFNQKILTTLFYTLGRNPSTWTTALTQLAQGTTTIKDIVTYKAEFIKKQSIRAEAKINLIFTHAQIIPQLCDHSAKLQLIQNLRILKKARGLMVIDRPNYYIDFISRPIFTLMIKENLLFHHYYLEYLDVTNLTNLDTLISIKNRLLSDNLINFVRWRIRNYNRFTIYGPEVKLKYKFEKESFYYSNFFKVRSQFQFGQTYFGTKYNFIFHYIQKASTKDLAD